MDNKTLIIVAAVALIAVVAGAAFFLTSGDDNNESDVTPDDSDGVMKPVDSKLTIFGNANNDTKIDKADTELIKKIIDKKASRFDYPLADANQDGKVDKADIELVQKMIDGKECTVYVQDQGVIKKGQDETEILKLNYPLKNIVTMHEDMIMFVQTIGAGKEIAGFVASVDSYPIILKGVQDLGAKSLQQKVSRGLTADGWKNIKELDINLHKSGSAIGAILVTENSNLGEFYDDAVDTKLPLLNIRVTDPTLALDGSLMLGFLLGKEYETVSQQYVDRANDVMKYVDTQVAKATKKVRFLPLCMTTAVPDMNSQYVILGKRAGGIAVNDNDRLSWLMNPEAITKYNDKADIIISFRTQDAKVVDPASLFEQDSMKSLEKSKIFNTLTYINLSMPIECKVLYTAYIMYPDLVTKEYADNALQWHIDNNLSYLNDTVSDGHFDVSEDMSTTISYDDWKASKA